jgi:hypothetical protein
MFEMCVHENKRMDGLFISICSSECSEIGIYRFMMLGDNLHTHTHTNSNKKQNKKQRKYTFLGRISLKNVLYINFNAKKQNKKLSEQLPNLQALSLEN